jgi:hypothetical protein
MVTDPLTSLELINVWKVEGHLTSQDQFTEGKGFSADQLGTNARQEQLICLDQFFRCT